MRLATLLIASLGSTTSLAAHDFWVQPLVFAAAPGVQVPITVFVGHGKDRQRWGVDIARVERFDDITVSSRQSRRAELHLDSGSFDAMLGFTKPGPHMLVLQSTHASSELPSIRFNDYATVEGLTPALQARAAAGLTDTPGREIYSRRTKTLIDIGAAGQHASFVTRPLGLTLEIVPGVNPYAANVGDKLPVQIFYEGKPLAGGFVKMTNLDFDAKPVETHLTDAAGRAVFNLPHQGKWQMNVIWTKALKGDPRADFDTTFSSLTFGFAPPAAR